MNNFNILVGIPTIGLNDYRFTLSLASLIIPENSTLMAIPRVMIDTARNMFCEKLLSMPEKTHLLMIDDDMTFEPDMLVRMLDRDVDIIGALAFKRRADYQPCVYQKKEDDNYYPILPQNFTEVDVVGTGAMLIKREVIEKMKSPLFTTYYDKKGNHFSVDFSFCIKAKKAGFKIFVDPEIEAGHIGDGDVITKNTFIKYYNDTNKKHS
jgi:GT2 family glycosyltransferase